MTKVVWQPARVSPHTKISIADVNEPMIDSAMKQPAIRTRVRVQETNRDGRVKLQYTARRIAILNAVMHT
jgi:hypothetical protein